MSTHRTHVRQQTCQHIGHVKGNKLQKCEKAYNMCNEKVTTCHNGTCERPQTHESQKANN